MLTRKTTSVDLPGGIRGKVRFDTLTAHAGWQRTGSINTKSAQRNFIREPRHSSQRSGVYQTAPGGRGVIDLTAHATRADVRSVGRYVPLQVGDRGRQWMAAAFLGGTSNDVKLRLKGNLNEFPFPEGKGGTFQVTAQVLDGVLDYASGWPKIDNIDGELTFRGRRMDMLVKDGAILGAKIARVRAEIADLLQPERVVVVTGEAEGPTSEFLSFIEKSPVADSIDRFTERFRAEGRGKLALKLHIPLANPKSTRVAGDFQFLNNRIESEELFFPFEQVNGHIEFTEASVRMPATTMVILGGPATLNGSTQKDGIVRFNLAGRANMDNFRRVATLPFVQTLHGSTDWKSSVAVRKRVVDMVFESTLQGIASDLPAPLAKTAPEILPFKLERNVTGPQQDRIAFFIGNVVSVQLLRRKDSIDAAIERWAHHLGGGPAGETRAQGDCGSPAA